MFEPVHGSAPDIAGQQKADPTAAILSASLLLDHLGYADAAADVERAVLADLADRAPGSVRRTAEVGDAVAARSPGSAETGGAFPGRPGKPAPRSGAPADKCGDPLTSPLRTVGRPRRSARPATREVGLP